AQRWRSENFERPVDLEGSGDDDSFPDDELDDLYSGSGSGFYLQGQAGVFTDPKRPPGLSAALLSLPSGLGRDTEPHLCNPVFKLLLNYPGKFSTSPEPWWHSGSVVMANPQQRQYCYAPTSKAIAYMRPSCPTQSPPPQLSASSPPPHTSTRIPPAKLPCGSNHPGFCGIRKLLPLPLTTAATAQATTPAAPSPPTTVAVLDTEAPTPRLVSTATSRPRALPRPMTTQEPDVLERSTLPLGTIAPEPTEVAQTPTPESFLTTIRDEPEVPVSGGPSGDFELPEEETMQPDTANEVVAVGGPAAKPSPPPGVLPKGARPGPGLLDNAIDSGSSAAQLPQKSILERKEVLVAVIVGGVVGALFAAFLVTLLIYRMKKKDEGSYTLEEPKQASVTYQKPDKQEEFYA
uniref:Syndecan n=1 Tax=Loxodonta africana TaxID=9785 RepID=G3U1W0_LOXAF